jgi:hypothetical protein
MSDVSIDQSAVVALSFHMAKRTYSALDKQVSSILSTGELVTPSAFKEDFIGLSLAHKDVNLVKLIKDVIKIKSGLGS